MLSEQRQPPPQPHAIVSYFYSPKAQVTLKLAGTVANPTLFESVRELEKLPTQAAVNPRPNGIFS